MLSPWVLALLTATIAVVLHPPSWTMPRWRPGTLSRGDGARRRLEAVEWVEALLAEVLAGSDARAALMAASASMPRVAPRAVAAARGSADIAAALASDGERSPLVASVSACWAVAAGTGAGLAASLATLADSARETERLHRELRAGLADPRATALVLAGLPVVGLGFGAMLGADPFAWLLGSPVGMCVLIVGLALEAVGSVWAWRIAVSCEALL